MTGDEERDRVAILAAAPGPIDCVFDILPPAATQSQVRAAVFTVRPNGRVALMGGVGMQGGPDLALPYSWLMRNNITLRGQWMYPREAPVRIIALIRARLIDLKSGDVTTFLLDAINAAVDHAAMNGGSIPDDSGPALTSAPSGGVRARESERSRNASSTFATLLGQHEALLPLAGVSSQKRRPHSV